MPPAAKRDVGVILFDVNSSNKDEALAAFMKICTINWVSGTKDRYRVILTNTKESQNIKNYDHLYDIGINDADPQPILNHIENSEAEEGDWLDALLLAIEHLTEAYESPGVITLQILYITKLDGCLEEVDMSKLERITNDLRKYDIFLYIIGPEVKLPFTITNQWDVSDAMKDIELDETNPVLAAAKRIVDATERTVISDLKVGINLFFSYRNPRGTQPWKMPLSFGSRLEFPACTSKIYQNQIHVKLTKDRQPTKYVLVEDESVDVDQSVLIGGVQRHGKFVKVTEGDMFKIDGPRSFSVVGFTNKKYVPEYYMREGTYYVLPDPEKPNDCSQALYNLIDLLAEEKSYAIVRRVYNANTKPKFFVLVPQPDLDPKCFAMSELPYADDLKQNFKVSVPSSGEEVVDEEFKQFFNSLDVWDDDCKVDVPLGPKMLLDCYVTKLANVTTNKYLEQEFVFDGLDLDYTENDKENEFLETFKATWQQEALRSEDAEDGD